MLELRICVPLGGNADELGFLKARLCLERPPTWAGQVLTLDRCETKPCEKPMMGQDVWFSMTFLDFDVGGRLNLQLHHATNYFSVFKIWSFPWFLTHSPPGPHAKVSPHHASWCVPSHPWRGIWKGRYKATCEIRSFEHWERHSSVVGDYLKKPSMDTCMQGKYVFAICNMKYGGWNMDMALDLVMIGAQHCSIQIRMVIGSGQVLEGSTSKPASLETSFRWKTQRRCAEGVLWGPRWFGASIRIMPIPKDTSCPCKFSSSGSLSRSNFLEVAASVCFAHFASEVSVKSCTNTVASCSTRSLPVLERQGSDRCPSVISIREWSQDTVCLYVWRVSKWRCVVSEPLELAAKQQRYVPVEPQRVAKDKWQSLWRDVKQHGLVALRVILHTCLFEAA